MEIELKVKLKLPDSCNSMSDDELGQLLFDSYINYVTVSHLRAATKWSSTFEHESEEEKARSKNLMNYHNTWADISNQPEFKIVRP